MIIRKLFRFESSHIVRNCYSERCKYSIHGHSYVCEVLLEASALDNAHMILDFGVLKWAVKELVDSFDHCHVIWKKDDKEYIDFCKKHSARWIELPVSPSAEQLSRVMFVLVDTVLQATNFKNSESSDLAINSVIIHETTTGYAQCFGPDAYSGAMGGIINPAQIVFSDGVKADWSGDWGEILGGRTRVELEPPVQQVDPYG